MKAGADYPSKSYHHHLHLSIRDMPKFVSCTTCGKKYTAFADLRPHREQRHPAPQEPVQPLAPAVQPEAEDTHPENFPYLQLSSPAATYRCPICNAPAANKGGLDQHYRSTHMQERYSHFAKSS